MTPSEPSCKAEESVKRHVLAGAVAGIVPFPWVSFASLAAVQLNMLRHLADIYAIDFSKEIGRSAIAALVGSDLSLGVSFGLTKLVPGPTAVVGVVSGGLLGAASTYALGKVFIQHFESGSTFLTFDPEKVRAYYEQIYKKELIDCGGSNFTGIRP
jgi:uncharacterized protein (DUF697 family)